LQGNERDSVPDPEAARRNKTVSKFAKTYGSIKDQTDFVTKGNSPWEGWGTALKPALEPITVARKPFRGTVAANVLEWGTGGINIDGCRVGTKSEAPGSTPKAKLDSYSGGWTRTEYNADQGRFPANLILSYPENEHILKESLTLEQKQKALKWIYENAKHTMSDMPEGAIPKTE